MEEAPPVSVPGGFEVFYAENYTAVVAVTAALCRSGGVAEDLAQEAFLRVHRDWERVSRMEYPGAWVRRIATNLALSRLRRLRSETAARLRLTHTALTAPDYAPADEAFWAEVRRLPKRQAQAIALRYVDDLPIDQIAATLEVAEGTVRALLHQGRGRLERQLSAKGWIE